jgi:pimeloyl-ACP methyl ester carboxylesterase
MRRLLRAIVLACAAMLFIAALALGLGVLYTRSMATQDRMAAAPRSGRYVDAGDTRLFVQEVGPSTGPAVVFIHGTGAWSGIWQAPMQLLAAKGYRAIAIDLPPFGYSLPPASGRYDKSSQARRILAALDSLGVEHAAFVAHSFGSSPLMEAVLDQPQRVSRLVLVSPALGLDSPLTDGRDTGLQNLIRQHWFSAALAEGILANPAYTGWLLKRFVTEKDKVTAAWVDRYRQPLPVRGYAAAMAQWMPELLAGRSTLRCDTPAAYRDIAVPVDLIWGHDDQITPRSQGEHLHALIKQSQLHILPGGHVPMIEEPQPFNQLLAAAFPDPTSVSTDTPAMAYAGER